MTDIFKRRFPTLVIGLMLISMVSNVQANYVDSPLYQPLVENSSEPICYEPFYCETIFCEPCNEWIISFDLLYWRALQNGLECGCRPEIKDKWDLGYRIGLEYDFTCPEWDISAYWTHFHNQSHHGNHDGDHAHWKLKFNTIDCLIGREFSNNSCYNYTPFFGIRAVLINEKLNAHFGNCVSRSSCGDNSGNDSSSFDLSDEQFVITDQHHKEKFWGIGPQIGIKADWKLGCNFSLYGSLGVGFLYGHFKVNVDDFESIPDPTDDGACHIERSVHACRAIADVSAGIQWAHCLCKNMEAIFKLGLEHHRYFNQNQIGGYGDLCLDGAIFSIGIKL